MKKIIACLLLLVLFIPSVVAETSTSQEIILNDSNCEDLAALLKLQDPNDKSIDQFVSNHADQMIEIKGFIYNCNRSWPDDSRYDIVLYAGDYADATGYETRFCFQSVLPEDLGLSGSEFPSSFLEEGHEVRAIGKIERCENDGITSLIYLAPVLLEERNSSLDGIDTSAYTTIDNGDKGNEVKALQQRLIDLYYLDGKADGKYGKNTKAAVEKFQKASNLEITGTADPVMQAILFSDNAPEATLSVSCSSIVLGSDAKTVWYVDGQQFTLTGSKTKTVKTRWGKYKFDAFGNYEKID